MSDSIAIPEVERCIYIIRGHKVMIDRDLAELYGVETKALNRAVRRNIFRFPSDFMFQLSVQEQEVLRCQIGTSNRGRGGRRYQPFVFTEQGIAMLSSVLNSKQAILVNIAIMRAFVKLRDALTAHKDLAQRVEKLEGKMNMHETDIRLMTEDIGKLKNPSEKPGPSIRGFSKE